MGCKCCIDFTKSNWGVNKQLSLTDWASEYYLLWIQRKSTSITYHVHSPDDELCVANVLYELILKTSHFRNGMDCTQLLLGVIRPHEAAAHER